MKSNEIKDREIKRDRKKKRQGGRNTHWSKKILNKGTKYLECKTKIKNNKK